MYYENFLYNIYDIFIMYSKIRLTIIIGFIFNRKNYKKS